MNRKNVISQISVMLAMEFEPFAASPPAPEDNFFYIRYPKTEMLFGKKIEQELPKLVTDPMKEVPSASHGFKERDWSKHTKPCQDVLHGIAPINTAVNPTSKPKPAGTDDGFKGEGAACGNSIVKVAHQMISSTRSPRGFTVASPSEDAQAPDPSGQYNLMARRGSKSLPATPAHSPNSSPTRRRKNYNRYFTSPFEPTEDAASRSWLTMALLGFKKDLTTSTSTLAEEEDTIENRLHGASSLAQSVESLGPAPAPKVAEPKLLSNDVTSQAKPKPQTFRPKPSELREMNFWSPTSM
ncbi:uncharacterized protein LOC126371099 isoform X2 [Pectinophora gossypiella]|uniref:Uncharacterized protein n=1 Tax=Pectinophora gossypiella TaxID=13191 RepID=A0A1E1WIS1_PECGO|nr:uncharacterized protein LOC126371099 isoform X2 [Pectinophora gossypiella]